MPGGPVREEITPLELRQQLTEFVELLASPGDEQVAWLVANRYPAEEMAEQYFDAVPGWFPRLRAHDLLGPAAERALTAVSEFLANFMHSSDAALWEDTALRSDPAWAQVRHRARIALQALAAEI